MTDSQVVTTVIKQARAKKRPDGTDYQALAGADEQRLAKESGLSRRHIQCLALENNIIPERYIRNQNSLSNEDQLKLLHAHVAVIGLGGLGGIVAELLARIGVGTITLVDGDSFEESNLNRQLFSNEANLGRAKVEIAAEQIALINPAIDCLARKRFINRSNYRKLLKNVTIAVDCLDSIPARFILQTGCRDLEIPLVSAAIGGKSGQILTIPAGSNRLNQIYRNREQVASGGLELAAGTLASTAVITGALECNAVVNLLVTGTDKLENGMIFIDLDDYSLTSVSFNSD
ncbi:MAG: thiamine biosynthesis protein ThiF [Proteobacteria bacterium]|nr:MAG: thiamine biosynthesis protein ThiF [Pseudomonadota bacterium]